MAEKYKTSYKLYPAWDYMEEVKDLNKASEKGWQLVQGGCFHSKFVYKPDLRFRYQIDYSNVDDMGRYLEIFREQGWEYVNSTFNGWKYFRKPYDASLPDEEYEIFTDRESLDEMQKRWANFAACLGVIICINAILCLVRLLLEVKLPSLIQFIVSATESAMLIAGAVLIRKPASKRNYLRSRIIFLVALFVLIFGFAGSIFLDDMRPHYSMNSITESISKPVRDNRIDSFEIKYLDFYYLDLELKSELPIGFEIINENGEIVYNACEKDFTAKDVRLTLPKGIYWISISADTGYELLFNVR